MSTPHVPFKTPLGHDELRTRTHRLSQRHRTILLLVDGRRPLAEVLSLAQQAGAAISHFEDVLRMGLVELPIDVAVPDPVMTEPGALATLHTTAIEVEVAGGPDSTGDAALPPIEEMAAAEPAVFGDIIVEPPVVARAVAEPAQPPVAQVPAPARPSPPSALPASAAEAPAPGVERLAKPKRAGARRASAPPAPAPSAAVTLTDLAAVPPAPPAFAPVVPAADALVQQVRGLLTDTVRQNPPPFGSRVTGRLAGAQTLAELRDLILAIERYLSAARRPRTGLGGLEHARELLGLGNTVVAEDSRSAPADDDDEFQTTR